MSKPGVIYLDLNKSETIISAATRIKEENCDDNAIDIIINCGGISQRGSVYVSAYLCNATIDSSGVIFSSHRV